jgi:hypothetical protein
MSMKISWIEADLRASEVAELVEKLRTSDRIESGMCGCGGGCGGCEAVSEDKSAPH